MKRVLIIVILCLPARAAVFTIEADNYSPGDSMHNPAEGIWLWRSDKFSEDVNYVMAHSYNDIYAVLSTNPDKPLGNNVIGNPIGDFPDYWFRDGPYLFLEVYNCARRITIESSKKPGVKFGTIITKMFDASGVRVAYNYTGSPSLYTDVGDYKIRYAIFQCSTVRSLDYITIDYMSIPEFADLVDWWLLGCSKDNTWCEGCDLNRDGIVNLEDYALSIHTFAICGLYP